jgi:hypothetical protein
MLFWPGQGVLKRSERWLGKAKSAEKRNLLEVNEQFSAGFNAA